MIPEMSKAADILDGSVQLGVFDYSYGKGGEVFVPPLTASAGRLPDVVLIENGQIVEALSGYFQSIQIVEFAQEKWKDIDMNNRDRERN